MASASGGSVEGHAESMGGLRIPLSFTGEEGVRYFVWKETFQRWFVGKYPTHARNSEVLSNVLPTLFAVFSEASNRWPEVLQMAEELDQAMGVMAESFADGEGEEAAARAPASTARTPRRRAAAAAPAQVDEAQKCINIWSAMDAFFGKLTDEDANLLSGIKQNEGVGSTPLVAGAQPETPKVMGGRFLFVWSRVQHLKPLQDATDTFLRALPEQVRVETSAHMESLPLETPEDVETAGGAGKALGRYNITTAAHVADIKYRHLMRKQDSLNSARLMLGMAPGALVPGGATLLGRTPGGQTTTASPRLSALTQRQRQLALQRFALDNPGYQIVTGAAAAGPQGGAPTVPAAGARLTGAAPTDGCQVHVGAAHTNAECVTQQRRRGAAGAHANVTQQVQQGQNGDGKPRFEPCTTCGRRHPPPPAICWGKRTGNGADGSTTTTTAATTGTAAVTSGAGAADAQQARIAELEAQLSDAQAAAAHVAATSAVDSTTASLAEVQLSYPTFSAHTQWQYPGTDTGGGSAGVTMLRPSAGTAFAVGGRLPQGFPVKPMRMRLPGEGPAGGAGGTRADGTVLITLREAVDAGVVTSVEVQGLPLTGQYALGLKDMQRRRALLQAEQEAREVNAHANGDSAVVQQQQQLHAEEVLQREAMEQMPGVQAEVNMMPAAGVTPTATAMVAASMSTATAQEVSVYLDGYRQSKATLVHHLEGRGHISVRGGDGEERELATCMRDIGADVTLVRQSEAARHHFQVDPTTDMVEQSANSMGALLGRVRNSTALVFVLWDPVTKTRTEYTLPAWSPIYVVDDVTAGHVEMYKWLLGTEHDRQCGGYVDPVGKFLHDPSLSAYCWRPMMMKTGEWDTVCRIPIRAAESIKSHATSAAAQLRHHIADIMHADDVANITRSQGTPTVLLTSRVHSDTIAESQPTRLEGGELSARIAGHVNLSQRIVVEDASESEDSDGDGQGMHLFDDEDEEDYEDEESENTSEDEREGRTVVTEADEAAGKLVWTRIFTKRTGDGGTEAYIQFGWRRRPRSRQIRWRVMHWPDHRGLPSDDQGRPLPRLPAGDYGRGDLLQDRGATVPLVQQTFAMSHQAQPSAPHQPPGGSGLAVVGAGRGWRGPGGGWGRRGPVRDDPEIQPTTFPVLVDWGNRGESSRQGRSGQTNVSGQAPGQRGARRAQGLRRGFLGHGRGFLNQTPEPAEPPQDEQADAAPHQAVVTHPFQPISPLFMSDGHAFAGIAAMEQLLIRLNDPTYPHITLVLRGEDGRDRNALNVERDEAATVTVVRSSEAARHSLTIVGVEDMPNVTQAQLKDRLMNSVTNPTVRDAVQHNRVVGKIVSPCPLVFTLLKIEDGTRIRIHLDERVEAYVIDDEPDSHIERQVEQLRPSWKWLLGGSYAYQDLDLPPDDVDVSPQDSADEDDPYSDSEGEDDDGPGGGAGNTLVRGGKSPVPLRSPQTAPVPASTSLRTRIAELEAQLAGLREQGDQSAVVRLTRAASLQPLRTTRTRSAPRMNTGGRGSGSWSERARVAELEAQITKECLLQTVGGPGTAAHSARQEETPSPAAPVETVSSATPAPHYFGLAGTGVERSTPRPVPDAETLRRREEYARIDAHEEIMAGPHPDDCAWIHAAEDDLRCRSLPVPVPTATMRSSLRYGRQSFALVPSPLKQPASPANAQGVREDAVSAQQGNLEPNDFIFSLLGADGANRIVLDAVWDTSLPVTLVRRSEAVRHQLKVDYIGAAQLKDMVMSSVSSDSARALIGDVVGQVVSPHTLEFTLRRLSSGTQMPYQLPARASLYVVEDDLDDDPERQRQGWQWLIGDHHHCRCQNCSRSSHPEQKHGDNGDDERDDRGGNDGLGGDKDCTLPPRQPKGLNVAGPKQRGEGGSPKKAHKQSQGHALQAARFLTNGLRRLLNPASILSQSEQANLSQGDAVEASAHDEPPSAMPYTHAMVLVVREGTNRVLLTRETEGVWIPGGRIEAGESPWSAALRELKEETGLLLQESVSKVQLDDLHTTVNGTRARGACFVVEVATEELPLLSDEKVKWERWLVFTKMILGKKRGVRFHCLHSAYLDHMRVRHHKLFAPGASLEQGGRVAKHDVAESTAIAGKRQRAEARRQQQATNAASERSAPRMGLAWWCTLFVVTGLAFTGGAVCGCVLDATTVEATHHLVSAPAGASAYIAEHHPHACVSRACASAGSWFEALQLQTDTTPLGEVPAAPPLVPTEKDEELGVLYGNHSETTEEQRQQVRDLAKTLRECFAFSMDDCTGYTGDQGDFTIELETDKPVFCQPRRHSPAAQAIIDEKCEDLKQKGIIRPSRSSKYAMEVTCPRKKNVNGEWTERRFCLDCRAINEHTVADRYRTARPEDLFHTYGRGKFKTKCDFRSGFMQVRLAAESQELTSFWWKGELWCFTRMGFGFKNATAKFQRCVDGVRAKYGLSDCCGCFVDDVLITSDTFEQHLADIERVLKAFAAEGLFAHPEKTVLCADTVEYLGHNVSDFGLTPHEAKVQAIRDMRAPTDIHELRAQNGFFNYYSSYVPGFSAIMRPLTMLTGKDVSWTWGADQQGAHDKVRKELTRPGAAIRHIDYRRPLVLFTDWSKEGISAVLTQKDDNGHEYMVACLSRSCNKHEKEYSSYQGEMLAAVWGMRSLRHYIDGVHFDLVTDHQPLCWLMSNPSLQGHHARSALSVQDLDFTIYHRAGKKHQNADVPSRFPSKSSTDVTGARMDLEGDARTSATAGRCGGHEKYEPPPPGVRTRERARLAAALTRVQMRDSNSWIQGYAPGTDDLLEGSLGDPQDERDPEPVVDSEVGESRQCAGRAQRDLLVRRASKSRSASRIPAKTSALLTEGEADAWGVSRSVGIDSTPIGDAFMPRALRDGVVLVDAFGGLCGGLEMALRARVKVNRYIYVDRAPEACDAGYQRHDAAAIQKVARHRVEMLHQQYPRSFPRSASRRAFDTLPQDMRRVNTKELVEAGALNSEELWLVTAGWECQDLSQAGLGAGLQGKHSRTFFDTLRVVGALQQLRAPGTTGHILENAPMQWDKRSHIRDIIYPAVCKAIGSPVELDAARFGSGAHRHRNWWTNLADATLLNELRDHWHRDPTLVVDGLLDPGRFSHKVTQAEGAQHYPTHLSSAIAPISCRALPTLVSYSGSRAFVLGAPGRLCHADGTDAGEPSPNERERILGYDTGVTAVAGVSERQRHEITGRCWDANCAHGLWVCIEAAWLLTKSSPTMPPTRRQDRGQPTTLLQQQYGQGVRIMCKQGWAPGEGLGLQQQGRLEPLQPVGNSGKAGVGHITARHFEAAPLLPHAWRAAGAAAATGVRRGSVHAALAVARTTSPPHSAATAALAAAQEPEGNLPAGHADVWHDGPVMNLLRTGMKPEGITARELDRVVKRARSYTWQGDTLYRRLLDGTHKVCPIPEQRPDIVRTQHQATGHYGARRTSNLLAQGFWWHGMSADAANHVRQCPVCAQVKATFGGNVDRPELQTLPVGGLHYRWSADLGELATSHRGTNYILVLVEHFSGFMVLLPLANKESETVAYAVETSVFGRYGAPAEMLTDQGGEFQGAFADMLEKWLVDHRVSGPEHPQSDGKTERAVKTVKTACRAMAIDAQDVKRWDDFLPLIALGYNASRQSSTGLTPYFLMHACDATVPPQSRAMLETPLSDQWLRTRTWDESDDDDHMAQALVARAAALKQAKLMAGDNLLIAQHRDRRYYRDSRSGAYLPRQRKFEVEDFVFVKYAEAQRTGMTPAARPTILQVKNVLPSGELLLQGSDGTTAKVPPEYCARCPLPNVDGTIRTELAVTADTACEVCRATDREDVMVICDGCSLAYHTDCHVPPLTHIPAGDWFCQACVTDGVGAEATRPDAPRRAQQVGQTEAAQRFHVTALALEGRRARVRNHWGVVEYLGITHRPRCFRVRFADDSHVVVNITELRKALIADDGVVPPVQTARAAAPGLAGREPAAVPEANVQGSASGPAPAKERPCELCRQRKYGVERCRLQGHITQRVAAMAQAMPGPSSTPLTLEVVTQHLQQVMPGPNIGERSRDQLQRLEQHYALRAEGKYPAAEVSPNELAALTDAVTVVWAQSVLDPFADLHRVSQHIVQLGDNAPDVLDNVAGQPGSGDPLHPGFLAHALSLDQQLRAVITVPWEHILDWVVPTWVRAGWPLLCVLVPGAYVATASAARLDMLARLHSERRAVLLGGLPWSIHNDRRMWLIVSSEPGVLAAVLRQQSRSLSMYI